MAAPKIRVRHKTDPEKFMTFDVIEQSKRYYIGLEIVPRKTSALSKDEWEPIPDNE